MFGRRRYSFSKSRNILKWCYYWYQGHWKTLSKPELQHFESEMESLDNALRNGNKKEASRLAKELEDFGNGKIHRPFYHYVKEIVFALAIALILATLVRQTWFELYEIPSGSMRPTYKEEDHLLVTKTTFGINMPLMTDHIYFNPESVKRGNPIIWSGDNVDLPNTDTKYFWVFPYKKRYIKRLIGKPGDTIYFYGGQIYSIDKDGNDLEELRDNPRMKKLEYIPFTTFEGKDVVTKPDSAGVARQTVFLHFNKPVGRSSTNWVGNSKGEIFTDSGWKEENSPQYQDFLGIKNFAMARLLTGKQLALIHPDDAQNLEKAPLYLELRHSPSISGSQVYSSPSHGYHHTQLNTKTSIIPLSSDKLDTLMNALYTARFEVKNGRVRNYSESPSPYGSLSPELPDIEDGTYEFYNGKASKISMKGYASLLPKDHPLYSRSAENVQKLFNLGILFNTVFSPQMSGQPYRPFRYAYFRDGDLYVMGSPIFKKNETALSGISFKDYGPPIKDGKIDAEFIKKFGVHVPEKHYLVLGDNHAMSGDSRSFGFVPEENLKGTPSFIFWPPSKRWGVPDQVSYPFLTTPNIIIWTLFLIAMLIWYGFHRWKLKQPIYKKLS